MLFYRLILALRWLRRQFAPVSPKDVARIDANAACPVCGEKPKRGRLRCVRSAGKIVCQHTCVVCGARWREMPVVADASRLTLPAVARNDVEKLEDKENFDREMREIGSVGSRRPG